MDPNIVYPVCMIVLVAYSAWIVSGQRKTIDKLTDKLIGVHREPKASKPAIIEDDVSPIKEPESKGWHDN